MAKETTHKFLGNKIHYAKHPYEALKNADALIIVTEWNEFRNPDFERMASLLKQPVIFDGRNLYDVDKDERHEVYLLLYRQNDGKKIINAESSILIYDLRRYRKK